MKISVMHQNIVDYWNAVERFTPPKLDTKNKLGYVESIQQEVLGAQDIPWQSRQRFCHQQTPNKTWVYNVFLGVVNYTDITQLIKKMLNNKEEEYNLQTTEQISCLCTFQLNNYGEIVSNTFIVPEYFISIACLNQKDKYPQKWMSLVPKMHQKVKDTYDNWVDILKNRPNSTVLFDDLKELLANIIDVSSVTEFHGCIRNNAVIYSSHIPVPNKFKAERDKIKAKEKFTNVDYYEEMLDKIKSTDLNIMNSFYLDDIAIVQGALKSKTSPIGKGLKDYLGLAHVDNKYDLRNDRLQLERLSNPAVLPSSRWPVDNKIALSIAQQLAVNLSLKEKDGIFSVNGPPGTGKSTLLRDIISEVITNRAKILSEFANPKDAFNNSTTLSIDRYKYKVWSLDSKLLGHEIVIASTNNTAVENISKEIPRLSEIDSNYGLEYFSEIANYVNNEQCWGIGAAVLGNKTNRTTFFEKFWSKQPGKDENDEMDYTYGLEYLLTTKNPKSDWLDSRQRFLSTLQEFTLLKSELLEFKDRLDECKNFYDNKEKLSQQINYNNSELEFCQAKIRSCENMLMQTNQFITNKKFQLQETRKLEPKWYIVLLEIFKEESSYQKWSNRCVAILDEIYILSAECEKFKKELSDLHSLIADLNDQKLKLGAELNTLCDRVKHNNDYIDLIKSKYSWCSDIADDSFWQSSDYKIQLSSPWIHKELQDVRARLFVEAMRLHYSFVINTSDYIINNFKAIRQVFSGEWPEEFKNLLKDVWATFFIVVPSVSTTFASFGKLFQKLDAPESLGWLLIDEAGQSAPQEALGAIYRAKRTIVVGDPLQIPPVVTIPKVIDDVLLNYYNVTNSWSVLQQSVQTLSDRINIYGTDIVQDSNIQWVGCPLRIHRRCLEPMFSVANKIAYDNLMIQATAEQSSAFDEIYPESQWIDVENGEFEGHWCKKQGEEVFKIIYTMIKLYKRLPNLYVISPFKVVAYKMQMLLRQKSSFLLNELSEADEKLTFGKWINNSVGTVHTFQGKQTDGVILLLGGNPSKIGAINWASKHPNILNVALTRAKHKFFVVGDYKIWSPKPYFQDLARVLSVVKR